MAGAVALLTCVIVSAAPGGAVDAPRQRRAARERAEAVRAELAGLLRDLSSAAHAVDRGNARWLALRLRVIELRAAEEEARRSFEARVRAAYIAGPGRAVDFLLSSSDLFEFAARLPYASTALALGSVDVSELAGRRRALEEVMGDAEDSQRSLAVAEARLARVRTVIEQRLSRAEAAVRADRGALAIVEKERKRYAGTLDRVSGATRTIRRQRGEAMFAAASPFLGPRSDCSIPRGLRSTGDTISGGTSWYGDAFRGKPTASGAIFWSDRFTVAHRTLPFGLFLLIRFRGRCVVSFLNDRGPYVDGRILDLSYASAQAIGLSGVHDVQATLLVRSR